MQTQTSVQNSLVTFIFSVNNYASLIFIWKKKVVKSELKRVAPVQYADVL